MTENIQSVQTDLGNDLTKPNLDELERVNLAHKQALDKLITEMKVQANKHVAEMQTEKDAAMDKLNMAQKEHTATLSKKDSDQNSILQDLER